MTFVDSEHVRMLTPDGTMQAVELSEHGVMAYSQAVQSAHSLALK